MYENEMSLSNPCAPSSIQQSKKRNVASFSPYFRCHQVSKQRCRGGEADRAADRAGEETMQ